jgi:hypothetical protein
MEGAPFDHVLVLNIDENGRVRYYGTRWEEVEDGIVDLTRDDAAAQLSFYVVDKRTKDIRVAPHFVQLTREAFFNVQQKNRCIIVPDTDDPTSDEYMAEVKALRNERRSGTKRKLELEEEEHPRKMDMAQEN